MCYSHRNISGSNVVISSENRYGGLLTKVETWRQRLNNVSASAKTDVFIQNSFFMSNLFRSIYDYLQSFRLPFITSKR